MLYLALKAGLSGLIIALVSEIAKRSPGFGGLIASLPLVSTLAMIWLWQETRDSRLITEQAESTFWFFLPSVPMFLVIPWLLRHGYPFWVALGLGCLLTMLLYVLMVWSSARLGVKL